MVRVDKVRGGSDDEEELAFEEVVGGLGYKRSGRAVEVHSDNPQETAEEVFEGLTKGAQEVEVEGYAGGTMWDRSDGSRVGLRTSEDGGIPTIDVKKNPMGSWREIKFIE